MDNADYTLSVALLCHNAKDLIQPLAARVHAVSAPRLEVIVVDEASTDGTGELLEAALSGLFHKVVYLSPQHDKAGAIAAAGAAATGDYVILQQAMLAYDPADYPALLAPLLAGEADAVFACGLDEDMATSGAEAPVPPGMTDIPDMQKVLAAGAPGAFCPAALQALVQSAAAPEKAILRTAWVALPRRPAGAAPTGKGGRRAKKSRKKGKRV